MITGMSPLLAQPAAHLEPVDARQHQVEDHQLRRRLRHGRQGLVAVRCRRDGVPGLGQVGDHDLAHGRVVVDDEYRRHGSPTFVVLRWTSLRHVGVSALRPHRLRDDSSRQHREPSPVMVLQVREPQTGVAASLRSPPVPPGPRGTSGALEVGDHRASWCRTPVPERRGRRRPVRRGRAAPPPAGAAGPAHRDADVAVSQQHRVPAPSPGGVEACVAAPRRRTAWPG